MLRFGNVQEQLLYIYHNHYYITQVYYTMTWPLLTPSITILSLDRDGKREGGQGNPQPLPAAWRGWGLEEWSKGQFGAFHHPEHTMRQYVISCCLDLFLFFFKCIKLGVQS